MKKGFTMIELIFVIVILGILASVAIPRLAGTRADAEISAAIANLRTLASDVATYYTTTGKFADKWETMTNVKVTNGFSMGTDGLYGTLSMGGQDDCLQIILSDAFTDTGTTGDGAYHPAAIEIDLDGSTGAATGTCATILKSKAFTDRMPKFRKGGVIGEDGKLTGGTAESYGVTIGSSATIY